MIVLAAIVLSLALAALPSTASASGPIYVYRHELPSPIAKLHTCVGPRQRTLREPGLWHVGKRRMFRIGCPENARNITPLPHRDDSGHVRTPHDDPDQFYSTVYYLADDARGRNAVRIVLPYPRADGSTLRTDAFYEDLDIGWSTRAQTSSISGVAFFDVTGTATYPPGEFMISTRIVPPDQPDIKNVLAIWRFKKGKAELIYWAETKETLPKDALPHQSPPYTIMLDKRPEK